MNQNPTDETVHDDEATRCSELCRRPVRSDRASAASAGARDNGGSLDVGGAAGSAVTLTCDTSNAVNVNINGAQFFGAKDTLTVFPTTTTSYTCIATNQLGQTATADPSRSPAGTESVWAYTHLPHESALRRIVVEKDERIEAEGQFVGNRPDIFGFVAPIGLKNRDVLFAQEHFGMVLKRKSRGRIVVF